MIRAQREDADNVENLILELCDNPEPPPDWIQLCNAVSQQKNNVEEIQVQPINHDVNVINVEDYTDDEDIYVKYVNDKVVDEDGLDEARAADPRDKQQLPSSSSGPATEPRFSLQTGVSQEEELNVPLDAEQLEIPMVEKFTKEKVVELESLFPIMSSKWVQEQLAQVLVQPFNGLEELEARFETKVDELFRESSGEDKGSHVGFNINLPISVQFKTTKIFPKRTIDMSNPLDVHFNFASGIFHKLLGHNSYAVSSVTMVQNPGLEARFKQKQNYFRLLGIPSDPVFGFHGTDEKNIDPILRNNFNLESVKRTAHGFGIYFSEMPEVSVDYVTGSKSFKSLILCQILLGTPGVNSKEVKDLKKVRKKTVSAQSTRSWAMIIGETNGVRDESSIDQILPFYVIDYCQKNN